MGCGLQRYCAVHPLASGAPRGSRRRQPRRPHRSAHARERDLCRRVGGWLGHPSRWQIARAQQRRVRRAHHHDLAHAQDRHGRAWPSGDRVHRPWPGGTDAGRRPGDHARRHGALRDHHRHAQPGGGRRRNRSPPRPRIHSRRNVVVRRHPDEHGVHRRAIPHLLREQVRAGRAGIRLRRG